MTEELISSTVHRLFVVGYSVTACLAIMVSVSSGVVTDYWKDNIDGCILYADIHQNNYNNHKDHENNSSWVMIGSDVSVCNYTTFTPVFFIFICLLCVSYHLRDLFCKHCWRAEESDINSDFWEMIVRLLVILSIFMAFLALVVACVVTHGHDYTCSGLRAYVTSQGLTPWLGISSAQIHELFDQLDCGFFYAALDHGLRIGNEDDEKTQLALRQTAAALAASHSTSITLIDSNAALEVAIVTGWFQFFLWLGLSIANVWLANRLKVTMLPESVKLPTLPAFFGNKE